ncbi:MAG: hypothetical protein AAFR21_03495 [Pseudomonadota bacterium]
MPPQESHEQQAQEATKKPKRSPLAGWLGGKRSSRQDEELPEMDIKRGLNRALRLAGGQSSERRTEGAPTENLRDILTCIEAALFSIDEIRDVIEQAYEIALSAQDIEDVAAKSLLAESYDELRLSINAVIDAVDGPAAQLVGKQQRALEIKLGGQAHYTVSPIRLDVSTKGLNLSPPRDAFSTEEEVIGVIDELDRALTKADRAAADYVRDAQFLIARLEAEAA